MVKLVIDIGNSFIKGCVFENDELIEVLPPAQNLSNLLSEVNSGHGVPASCLISTVRDKSDSNIKTLVEAGIQKIIRFSADLKLPVTIKYQTPETLGTDRIANICGGFQMFPGMDVLVVDMGTCIKYDFLSKEGDYWGGGIAPGLNMRYKSLNIFTEQLPDYKPIEIFPELTGQSTEASIRSGVEQGILAEVQGIISQYRALYHSVNVILTGGDSQRFEDKLKSPIFVAPNLTLNGLKVILDTNE